MKGVLKNNRGIALYLVLWVIALLTVIAGEFSHAIRTDVNITRNFKEETQTYYLATSGVFWAIEGLLVDEFVPRPVEAPDGKEKNEDIGRRFNIDIPAVPFGVGRFKVEKENESGKVNINRAQQPLLEMMLNHFEIDDAAKGVIVASILDWRDKDSFHGANGAEDAYYQSLPEPYKCKNGDFTTIEELLLVRGITPEIFYGGLKEMVSVCQNKETPVQPGAPRIIEADFNKININAASPRMLRSLPKMTDDLVLKISDYRKQKDFHALSELVVLLGADIYMAVSPYITLRPSPYWTIKSTGMLDDSRTRRGVQAVVKMDRTLKKGYEILQWIDSLEYGS